MVKIAVCGANGKMGKVISSVIGGRDDCTVLCGIDKITDKYADFEIYDAPAKMPEKPDVILDFSHPSVLDSLLEYALANGTPLVLCTTGFSETQTEKIKKASEQIPVFFSFNMSLGINLLANLAKTAHAILGDQFDVEIVEKHHNQKIDAPSGTALMLADAINSAADDRYNYVYDRHCRRQKREKSEIGIHSVRGGTIVGEHEIIFAGRDEVITLSHQAASKEVFAVGGVNAAVYLSGKPAGLYDMSALIENK
ncbi:MAG: 4-hydroxy-tetrahydrodipicolinate reductase [Oscillospiraceae bacterium]|nr:4-hydroxy-tetrahydrodipicolinate reductase [Oscillospiraceae bacterium]MDD7429857.1 4-hydroxy-tetrahydrodipicolinate reductase [Oscillospiraceae bacterium]MDY2848636.1 4-hydroxy-tetrahydrodipicolinate reductase [Oscillospiraceae bacterium]